MSDQANASYFSKFLLCVYQVVLFNSKLQIFCSFQFFSLFCTNERSGECNVFFKISFARISGSAVQHETSDFAR